jgi:hypothetical protein
MTRRLTTILITIFLMVIASSVQAQNNDRHAPSLKGISAVVVLVEKLDDSAMQLGLTEEAIHTDVESKLRLAGMRVVTPDEGGKLPGMPVLYIQVNVAADTRAASIEVELEQNAQLERNGELVLGVKTWTTGGLVENASAQDLRNVVKDNIDVFLKAWQSVNSKK